MITKAFWFSLVMVLLILISGCNGQKQPGSIIPEVTQANVPVIDGTLSPGEWDTALQESFVEGSLLYLLVSGESLYLGAQVNPQGMVPGLDVIVGNVYLNRGDEISILHSSAALGTAKFQKSSERWLQSQGFTWSCRDYSNSESARAERDAFLQQEGWVASTGYMGNFNEMEFQIKMTGESTRFTIAFLNMTARMDLIWPIGVQDDSLQFTSGDLTASAAFTPEEWSEITLTPDGEVYVQFEQPDIEGTTP